MAGVNFRITDILPKPPAACSVLLTCSLRVPCWELWRVICLQALSGGWWNSRSSGLQEEILFPCCLSARGWSLLLPLPGMRCCGCVADPRNPGFEAVDTLCLTLGAVSVFQRQGQERHHGRMECFVGVLGKNRGDADVGRGNGKRNKDERPTRTSVSQEFSHTLS